MAFHIHPYKEFLVRPALPQQLSRLAELSMNLLWTWDHGIRGLFRRLDPGQWRSSGHNPVLMLGRLSQGALEKAAADPRFLSQYRRACDRLDSYLQTGDGAPRDRLVGYFSMEYGLTECMSIYSGGLGVLSGDHLKAASDLGIPLVGVGLLYQKGYLEQSLNPDGWQQEHYPDNDFYTLPVKPVTDHFGQELKVSVKLPAGQVFLKVWQIQAGRVSLYLLDSNINENERAEDRDITDQLYGGDIHVRIRQEIALGIGGLRALKAIGLEPTVFHMNEGHSAFLAIERMRLLMKEHRLSFEEALEASRSNNVFTTHTSVPAGLDLFDPGLVDHYFHEYCEASGIPLEKFLALGRRNPADAGEPFSMAIAAFKTSCWRNSVSVLHRRVSQTMWQDLWPQLPVWEVPITSITNGVHLPGWLNSDFATLYDQYLQPDWRDRYEDPKTWELIDDVPDAELWEAHKRRKRQFITYARARVVEAATQRKASATEIRRLGEVLDPDAFTIGFARRFATYKRATLIFRDLPRLKKLLSNPKMPVQIVIAGKAHPKDGPGKAFIREIVQLTRDPELSHRLVFLENYGLRVARQLYHGVDLWLNNPRRGEEACGTSGMKAGINGVLNLSIFDGWFDEAYEVSGGWAIGDRMQYSEDQDEIHASAISSLMENEIVPMYFDVSEEGVPKEWMRRVKLSLRNLSPRFSAKRMLDEYTNQLYWPAHQAFRELAADDFRITRQRSEWERQVRGVWDQVRFIGVEQGPDGPAISGRPLPLRTVIDLAGLTPKDVRVDVVIGRVGSEGYLEDTEVLTLPAVEQRGSAYVFAKEFVPHTTGRLGFSLRICSNHYNDPLTRPCNALLKWG